MRLGGIVQNRITLLFEYWRPTADGEELVARGEQVVACMRREGKRAVPTRDSGGPARGAEAVRLRASYSGSRFRGRLSQRR